MVLICLNLRLIPLSYSRKSNGRQISLISQLSLFLFKHGKCYIPVKYKFHHNVTEIIIVKMLMNENYNKCWTLK
jgi:hypothetical protein